MGRYDLLLDPNRPASWRLRQWRREVPFLASFSLSFSHGGTRLRPIVPESKGGNWELMGPCQRVRWPGEAPVDVLHTLWDSLGP